ncbi:hypothetical protein BaRGS_00014052 [Batillaria attramentaria]|uniref:CARD domain-containing protein n=1 Tax=Batillaria attramentaria TaxID=370345 RepID=A0ABD0L502_9CAEN
MMHRPSIRYPRGKVTAEQELCLQLHKEFLTEEMDSVDVVQRLRSQFILSSNDEEYILGTAGTLVRNTRREQNGRLVDTITMRGPRGFDAFLQALADTGHDAAYRKLCQTMNYPMDDRQWIQYRDSEGYARSESPASPGRRLNESGYDDEVSYLLDRVDELSGSVEGIKKHLEVLSIRITKVDSGRQAEIDRLKRELDKARAELERLRGENDELSALVSEKSEQLDEAKEKIALMEKRIVEMESENDSLQRRFKDQTKRVENLQTRTKQAYSKLNDLEKEVVDQRQQHKKELDDQRQQHRKDIDQFRRRIDREKERRMHMEDKLVKLEEHKQHSDTVMKRMQEKFLEMERSVQELKQTSSGRKPNVSDGRGQDSNRSCKPGNAATGMKAAPRNEGQKLKFPNIPGKGKSQAAKVRPK